VLVPVRGPFIRIVFFTAGRGGGIRVSGLGLLAACVDTANCLQVTVGFLLIHFLVVDDVLSPADCWSGRLQMKVKGCVGLGFSLCGSSRSFHTLLLCNYVPPLHTADEERRMEDWAGLISSADWT